MTEWLAIENAVLLPMDAERRILDPGHVVVHGDRIVAVGQGAAPRRPDLAVIDAEGGIVLPGLIDAHAHAGHALTKGIGASSAAVKTGSDRARRMRPPAASLRARPKSAHWASWTSGATGRSTETPPCQSR